MKGQELCSFCGQWSKVKVTDCAYKYITCTGKWAHNKLNHVFGVKLAPLAHALHYTYN